MRRARAGLVVLGLVPLLLGGKCGGGDGGGGSPPVVSQSIFDPRCAPLGDLEGFPPDYDFVPGVGPAPTRLLAATTTRSTLVPLSIEAVPFSVPPGLVSYGLPGDADGDGRDEFSKSIDGVRVLGSDLALVTISGDSPAVLFVDPRVVGPRSVRVEVPVGFDPASFAAYPGLPAPGRAALQRGVTVAACIDAGPGARDSRGELLVDSVAPIFECNGPGTFPSSFPSGAAFVAGRLFVSTSNLGVDQGQADTQFLPGSVIVFELDVRGDPLVVSPSTAGPGGRPWLTTSAFNPTDLEAYTTPAGRRLVLVTQTGAIGIQRDDPNTDPLEGGSLPLSEGAIDVIDADALELVATIPLSGANPSFRGLAIDPTGRVALFGDINARALYAIDLAVLDALPPAGRGGGPVILDGAVIFDGLNPLRFPARAGGAPAVTCPGQVQGVGFSAAGDRAYALDFCDGTVAAFDVDLSGAPSTGELRTRIVFSSLSVATAPLRADTLGQVRQPAALAVRPGRPGIDYAGPDVFFTIGDPEGFLCGVRIDAP